MNYDQKLKLGWFISSGPKDFSFSGKNSGSRMFKGLSAQFRYTK